MLIVSIGAQLEPGGASEFSRVRSTIGTKRLFEVFSLCVRVSPQGSLPFFNRMISIQWSCKCAGRIRFLDIGEQALLCRYELRGRSVIGFVRMSLLVVTHIQVVRA